MLIANTYPVSDLDPFSPEFRADPYARYAELRALGPVVWLARHEIWAVTDDAHARAVLGDHARFSNAGGGGLRNHFVTAPWRPRSIVLEVDPPEHTRARAVLSRVLSPAVVRTLRADFEGRAERLLDGLLARGTALDAVTELAQPFVLEVFADAVGIAAGERGKLLTYGAMVFGSFGPDTSWYRDLMQDAEEIGAWIVARCQRAALSPGGIGAEIYAAADVGEVTEHEAMLLVRSLLSAGVDTTIDSIGLALRCLLDHPDQWRLLRRDPARARAAFEEATRYDSSSQSLFRTTLEAVELGGARMQKHQKLLVLLGSAGRDPARWEQPDRFDITRRTTGHLGYGTGIHGCVAQMMARLEAETFFTTMARRVAHLEAAGDSVLRLTPGLRGLASLPLRLHGGLA